MFGTVCDIDSNLAAAAVDGGDGTDGAAAAAVAASDGFDDDDDGDGRDYCCPAPGNNWRWSVEARARSHRRTVTRYHRRGVTRRSSEEPWLLGTEVDDGCCCWR